MSFDPVRPKRTWFAFAIVGLLAAALIYVLWRTSEGGSPPTTDSQPEADPRTGEPAGLVRLRAGDPEQRSIPVVSNEVELRLAYLLPDGSRVDQFPALASSTGGSGPITVDPFVLVRKSDGEYRLARARRSTLRLPIPEYEGSTVIRAYGPSRVLPAVQGMAIVDAPGQEVTFSAQGFERDDLLRERLVEYAPDAPEWERMAIVSECPPGPDLGRVMPLSTMDNHPDGGWISVDAGPWRRYGAGARFASVRDAVTRALRPSTPVMCDLDQLDPASWGDDPRGYLEVFTRQSAASVYRPAYYLDVRVDGPIQLPLHEGSEFMVELFERESGILRARGECGPGWTGTGCRIGLTAVPDERELGRLVGRIDLRGGRTLSELELHSIHLFRQPRVAGRSVSMPSELVTGQQVLAFDLALPSGDYTFDFPAIGFSKDVSVHQGLTSSVEYQVPAPVTVSLVSGADDGEERTPFEVLSLRGVDLSRAATVESPSQLTLSPGRYAGTLRSGQSNRLAVSFDVPRGGGVVEVEVRERELLAVQSEAGVDLGGDTENAMLFDRGGDPIEARVVGVRGGLDVEGRAVNQELRFELVSGGANDLATLLLWTPHEDGETSIWRVGEDLAPWMAVELAP
ncbi:hypothetical protein [Engelhardtia mirabilis]|uniref:Uncharacterized protein n=1 Tax=Engelhardtia mirabilis TaxID=2528011 RepID=A0A518BRX3_9BACT|nr:hypothetical protein Pla133_48390 [Planctomycetes bacterium Pla133]QDV04044.1 hypothetical protein Pla86_48370 [Planctomycetes bacterium Pla86]